MIGKLEYTFYAKGHKNISCVHKNTFEFTKDIDLTVQGDCIAGVAADFKSFELKKLLKFKTLDMKITSGTVFDSLVFETNKGFNSSRELVIRLGNFISERTFGIFSTKSAKMLDRGLVSNLQKSRKIKISISPVIKLIIFDFDDTLEDYQRTKTYAHKTVAKKLLVDFGVYEATTLALLDLVCELFSRNGVGKDPILYDRHLWFGSIFEFLGINPGKKYLDKLVLEYWHVIKEKARPLPGSINTVKKLSKQYHVAVLSDSDGTKKIKTDRMKATGFSDLVKNTLTSDDTGKNKPNPEAYTKILDKYGCKPCECVMIGDKPEVDLLPAKNIGMKTIWVRHGEWAKRECDKEFDYIDFIVDDFHDLPGIIYGL